MRMRHIVISGLPDSYNIFAHYLIHDTIFEKKEKKVAKYVFLFSLQLLSQILLILRRTERSMIKNVLWS